MFKKLKEAEAMMHEIRIKLARSSAQVRSESPALNQIVSMLGDVTTTIYLQQEAWKIRLTILSIALSTGMVLGMIIMFLIIK